MAATSIGQYVTRFQIASSTSTTTSNVDIDVMTAQTWPMSAIRGRAPTNTPIAMAGNRTI